MVNNLHYYIIFDWEYGITKLNIKQERAPIVSNPLVVYLDGISGVRTNNTAASIDSVRESVLSEEKITLYAIPTNGYSFKSWYSLDQSKEISKENPYTYTLLMDEKNQVEFTFLTDSNITGVDKSRKDNTNN